MAEPEDHPTETELQAAEVLDGRTLLRPRRTGCARSRSGAWASRIAARREALDLEQQFLADGFVSWSEADPDGNLVIRDAQSVREDRQHE